MTDLRELTEELDAWDAAGLTATFWWRDDDAIESTPQLDRLLRIAEFVPLALAVIPDLATPALAEQLRHNRRVSVLQHGWRHKSYTTPPQPNSEYPSHRPAADVLRELHDGRLRLSALFGELLQPVFAPPWHGFDDGFLPLLRQCGLWSISRAGQRRAASAAAGVFECNVHAPLLLWHNPPEFIGEARAVERLLRHLQSRRQSSQFIDEPTGILTHHLVEDAATYDFIARLADAVSGHKAAKWLAASDIFPTGPI